MTSLWRSRPVRFAVLSLLAAGALLSLAVGLRNAIHRSMDFQWSGTRMILAGVQPWQEFLDGNPHHLVRSQQFPNYLPLLYLLLAPFGLLEAEPAQLCWCLANIVFAVVAAVWTARWYGLGREATIVASCIFLMGTPVHVTLGNGQTSLLVLLFWLVSLPAANITRARGILAGVCYVKFSFAPPLFLYIWLRTGLRRALVSVLPALAGLMTVWLWLHRWHGWRGLAAMVLQPLEVAKTGYYPNVGAPNLMDMLLDLLVHAGVPYGVTDNITLTVSVALCAAILYRLLRGPLRADIPCQLALLATLSVALFKHHAYDFVVILFPLCYAMAHWRRTPAKVMLVLIFHVFFFDSVLDHILGYRRFSYYYITFPAFLALMACTWKLGLICRNEDTVAAHSA